MIWGSDRDRSLLAPQTAAERRHLLTVILEDYFQVAPLRSVVQSGQWYRFETRVEANTRKALDLLDEFGIKATFFVLGWIADEIPEVVAEVAARGHEVACKGYYHRSIRQLSREEFRDDLVRSREALERAAGTPVVGYRIAHGWFAPADLWALDVLAEEGFAYDSSIRPLFRAYAHEPWRRFAHTHRAGDSTLWEFPICTYSLGGWCLPIAGGNYLRQFPHSLMRRAAARWERTCESPLVFYFHVWELDPDQPRIHAAPLVERIRQYRNLGKMPGIIRHYLGRYRFVGAAEYLALQGHTPVSAVARPARRASPPARRQPTAATAVAVRSEPKARPRTPVTVVVPCFNEELILPYLANTLRSVEATLIDHELSFVFVDDGSLDGTWAALQKIFGGRPNCRILHHGTNRGVAAAILTGIRDAATEIVCSIDCDCTYDPHQLQSLIPMLKEGVAMVTASPYHRQGSVRNVPSWRLFLSKGLSLLYRLVLNQPLATYTSCFRVYRRQAVAGLLVREGGFLGVAEMLGLLALEGGLIVECPAVLDVRLLGRSKMKVLKTAAGHLRLLARLAGSRFRHPGRRSRKVENHVSAPPASYELRIAADAPNETKEMS